MLERASLVTKRVDGRRKMLSGDTGALRRAGELLEDCERLWTGRIEAIDRLINEDERKQS